MPDLCRAGCLSFAFTRGNCLLNGRVYSQIGWYLASLHLRGLERPQVARFWSRSSRLRCLPICHQKWARLTASLHFPRNARTARASTKPCTNNFTFGIRCDDRANVATIEERHRLVDGQVLLAFGSACLNPRMNRDPTGQAATHFACAGPIVQQRRHSNKTAATAAAAFIGIPRPVLERPANRAIEQAVS